MPLGNWNLEVLDLNGQRAYPFTEDATRTDITGSFTIPNEFLLNLYFPVHAGQDVVPTKFYLSRLTIFSQGIYIAVSYDDGTSTPPVAAVGIIPRSTHREYNSYALVGQNDFDDSVGRFVVGRLSTLDRLPPGEYLFGYEDGKLEVDCIRPQLRYVSSLKVVNGSDVSPRLYGDIEIEAGKNMRITVNSMPGQPTRVRFDAIGGEGLNEECICVNETEGECIRTINGVAPDVNGNINLYGSTCLTISTDNGGLRFIDVCSEPCCDCKELQALTGELKLIQNAKATVEGFANRLGAQVNTMWANVLASRLGDVGCLSCDV